jgi:hypothetical protein
MLLIVVSPCSTDVGGAAGKACSMMTLLLGHGAYAPWVRTNIIQAQYFKVWHLVCTIVCCLLAGIPDSPLLWKIVLPVFGCISEMVTAVQNCAMTDCAASRCCWSVSNIRIERGTRAWSNTLQRFTASCCTAAAESL